MRERAKELLDIFGLKEERNKNSKPVEFNVKKIFLFYFFYYLYLFL